MWIIYSKSKSDAKIFSRGISFFTKKKEDKFENVPSHMALVFGGRFMLEAVGGAGVRLNFFPTFLKHNDVIEVFDYKRGPQIGLEDKKLVIEACLKYHGRSYDYIGVLWFAFYIFRMWLFNMPLPKSNSWDGANRSFCTELMEFIDSRDYETVDPNSQMKMLNGNQDDYQLLFSARKNGNWEEFWQPYQADLERKSSRKPMLEQ